MSDTTQPFSNRSDMTQEETYAKPDRVLAETHYEISEFLKIFSPLMERHLIGESRQRPFCRMALCEIMTILVTFQRIGALNFKSFYKEIIWQYHREAFPTLVSYARFVYVAPIAIIPLSLLLKFRLEMSAPTGVYAVDSTPLRVCHNLRIPRHRGFRNWAGRGKTSTGWFYGFKPRFVTNHQGELMNVFISAGNHDDRKPVLQLVQELKGKLLGDRGYIKKELAQQLLKQGLELITTLKKNMKPVPRSLVDRLLLRKRAIVETINDLFKNHFQIEHSRHRSLAGLFNNILSSLIAYTFYPSKPHMRGVEIVGALTVID